MHNLNILVFHFINNAAGQSVVLDWFFVAITSYVVYLVAFAVTVYVLFYVPYIDKGIARLHSLGQAAEMVLGVAVTGFIVWAIKVAVALPRPFTVLVNVRTLIPIAGTNSFPSGHAAMTCAVATAVYFYHPRLGKFLFAFAFLVALSRIFVGVHYPTDVLVGLFIGYIIPKLIHIAFSSKKVTAA